MSNLILHSRLYVTGRLATKNAPYGGILAKNSLYWVGSFSRAIL